MRRLVRLAFGAALRGTRPLRSIGRRLRRVQRVAGRPLVEVTPRPLNVVVEVSSLDVGGLEKVVFDLASRWDRRSIRPVVTCLDRGGRLADELRRTGVPVHVVGRSRDAFASLLARERADVLNAHYSVFGAPIAAAYGVPQVHVIHNSYLWLREWSLYRIAARFEDVERFVAVSGTVAEFARRRLRVPSSRLDTIPNGIDLSPLAGLDRGSARREMRSELGIADDAFVFLHVGTYEPRKGHRALLRAFERVVANVPNVFLVCAGNSWGPAYPEELTREVRRRGIVERVRFLDFRQDVFRLCVAADAFVLPSVVEGFSLSTLEAAAVGLPLVLTDTGGARELIAGRKIGLLVPGYLGDQAAASLGDVERVQRRPPEHVIRGLAVAMSEMALHPDVWRQAAAAGREIVTRECEMKAVARRYERVFAIVSGCRSVGH